MVGVTEADDTAVSAPGRLRLSRRSLIGLGAGAVVVAAVVIAFASGAFGGGSAAPSSADNAYPTSLQTVTRQSLSEQTQVSATLGYAAPSTIVAPAGTTPQDLAQAKQTATTAQAQLANGAGGADGRHGDAGSGERELVGRPGEIDG